MDLTSMNIMEENNQYAPFNTQTISIPHGTIEVIGHQTFMSNEMYQKVDLADSMVSLSQE
jgi:hypothetical protein